MKWYYFLTARCNRKLKSTLNEGIKYNSYQLDIIMIVRKMLEIEKLKALLLTEDQMNLFDLIPKPKLNAISQAQVRQANMIQTQLNYFGRTYDSVDERLRDCLKSYQKIKNSKELTNIKLINMMDNEFSILMEFKVQQ